MAANPQRSGLSPVPGGGRLGGVPGVRNTPRTNPYDATLLLRAPDWPDTLSGSFRRESRCLTFDMVLTVHDARVAGFEVPQAVAENPVGNFKS